MPSPDQLPQPTPSSSPQQIITPTQAAPVAPTQSPEVIQPTVVAPQSADVVNQAAPVQPQVTPNVPPRPAIVEVQSASQLKVGTNDDASNKKWILPALAILVAGIGIFAILVLTNVVTISRFKTIKYDNGKGDTYSVKFYGRHSVQKVSQSNNSFGQNQSDLQQLVSKVTVNDKAPIAMWIESNSGTSAAFSTDDCTKTGKSINEAFKVHINYIEKDVPVCSINLNSREIIYLVTFHDSYKGYLVFIDQDVDIQAALKSSAAAKSTLAKAGLTDYQDDLKTIIGSIKPVD